MVKLHKKEFFKSTFILKLRQVSLPDISSDEGKKKKRIFVGTSFGKQISLSHILRMRLQLVTAVLNLQVL